MTSPASGVLTRGGDLLGRDVPGLELGEEAVDDALLAHLVLEGLPDDLARERGRQGAHLLAELHDGLLALGLDLTLGRLRDAGRLGLGLAACSGFRVFVPLLAASVAYRVGWLAPSPGFAWLGSWAALLTLATATLAEMAGLFAQNHANVVALEQTQKDHPFSTYDVELDVQDLAHLTRILSALRASDAVAQAERM